MGKVQSVTAQRCAHIINNTRIFVVCAIITHTPGFKETRLGKSSQGVWCVALRVTWYGYTPVVLRFSEI